MNSAVLSSLNDYDKRRWSMFAILLVGAFLPPLDFFIINVALPAISTDLHPSDSQLQLTISTYAGFYAVMLITGGRLGDLFGRSRMFFLGLTGFALSSAICGFAVTPWMLIIGRALQGITAAIMAPQGLASIHAIFPENEKPRALGLYGAVFGLASVAGQILGGIFIATNLFGAGWRVIFLVNIPVVALVLLFGMPLLRNSRAAAPRKLDLVGVAFSVLTLACLVVPLIEGREQGWPIWTWCMLLAFPLLAYTFWRYESRYASQGGDPLIDPAALKAPGLRLGLTIALLFYAIAAFFLLLSIYLQSALAENALSAGLVFLPFGLGFLLGPLSTPYAGKLFGTFLNPFGMALEAIGFLALAVLIKSTPTAVPPDSALLAGLLFIIGFGQGLALPTLVRAITSRVSSHYAGMIAGVVNSTLQISVALSVAVIGGLFFSLVGNSSDSEVITHAFTSSITAIAIALAIGALLAVRLALEPNSSAKQ